MRWLGVKMTAGGSWEGLEVVIIMILGGVDSSVWWKVCMTCRVINLKIGVEEETTFWIYSTEEINHKGNE